MQGGDDKVAVMKKGDGSVGHVQRNTGRRSNHFAIEAGGICESHVAALDESRDQS
jgi:hypothetical protein